MSKLTLLLFNIISIGYLPVIQAAIFLNQGMETYTPFEPIESIEGEIISSGSTRLLPLMEVWGKEFKKIYPQIIINNTATDSSKAAPALLKNEINIAMMSRPMTEQELQKFHTEKGYFPLKLNVALDAVAVYVNSKNPLTKITIPELDVIFSQTYLCQLNRAIVKWSQLDGRKGQQIITLYGHNEKSGANKIFSQVALCQGQFKDNIKEVKLQNELLHQISLNRYSIGYSSLNMHSSYSIKPLLLARSFDFPAYAPSPKNISSGSYPLRRELHLYVNKESRKKLPLHLYEFIKFVLSKQGQEWIKTIDAIPMAPHLISLELLKLQ